MALDELKDLKASLKYLQDKGFSQPSISSWGSIVLVVKNNDGSLRMCIDYRQLMIYLFNSMVRLIFQKPISGRDIIN